MQFTTRKGRPPAVIEKCVVEKTDYGTMELRLRRMVNYTKEAIDICAEKGIIDNDSRWAAMHFRWLYTVRFGAPDIAARDLEGNIGRSTRADNMQWRELREREYSMAVEKLRKTGALKVVMNIAVFNHFPRFLTGVNCAMKTQIIQNHRELTKLKEGLEVLHKHWKEPVRQAETLRKWRISQV